MPEVEITVELDDMSVLSEGGTDVFVLSWGAEPEPPPFAVHVRGRMFAFCGRTFLMRGGGAVLPEFLREQEREGMLTLLIDRTDRYYAYLHDPNEGDEDGDEAEGTEEVAEAVEAGTEAGDG